MDTTTKTCRLALTLALLVLGVLTAGCAATPKSKAYTLNKDMKGDTVYDKASNEAHRQDSPILKNTALVAGSAIGPQDGLLGLSFESLAASMVVAVLDINTTKSYEKTWIAGRVPKTDHESGREVQSSIFSAYDDAVQDVLTEQGFEYEQYAVDQSVHRGTDLNLDDIYEYRVYIIRAPEYGCEYFTTDEGGKDSSCSVLVQAGGLEAGFAPASHPLAGQAIWKIDRSVVTHKIQFFSFDDAQLPTIDLHEKISKNLPGWAYMFVPDSPNYLAISSEGKVKGYPYFLNKGEELHFVTPKDLTTNN